jgi:hypothetical protein
MGLATYIAITMALLTVLLVGLALWYYFDKMPSPQPYDLQLIQQESDGGGNYIYKFIWKYDIADRVEYQAYIYQGADSIARTKTQQTTWTVSLSSGTYTFKIIAIAGHRPPSEPVILNFTTDDSNLPEAYIISPNGGGYLFTKGKTCSSASDCVSGQTCDNGHCYYTDDAIVSIGTQSCSQLGASIATEQQVYQAFTRGADWCAYGVAVQPPHNTPVYIFPTYNVSGDCGLKSGDTPRIYKGGSGKNTNITCYGIKPSSGTKVNVLGTDDGRILYKFSDNLQMWSQYDEWNGTSKYGCTQPGEICTAG